MTGNHGDCNRYGCSLLAIRIFMYSVLLAYLSERRVFYSNEIVRCAEYVFAWVSSQRESQISFSERTVTWWCAKRTVDILLLEYSATVTLGQKVDTKVIFYPQTLFWLKEHPLLFSQILKYPCYYVLNRIFFLFLILSKT